MIEGTAFYHFQVMNYAHGGLTIKWQGPYNQEDHLGGIQLEAEVFNPPDGFPLITIVNKSWNSEHCVTNMLQIIQNMMVS